VAGGGGAMPLSPAQEAGRAKCLVTASEMAALFGLDPKVTPYMFHQFKLGKLSRKAIEDEEHVQLGNILEKPIAEHLARREGWQIRKVKRHIVGVGLALKDIPLEEDELRAWLAPVRVPGFWYRLGVSLDFEVTGGVGAFGLLAAAAPQRHKPPLEIKAVGRFAGLTDPQYRWENGEPPLPVLLQNQAQIAGTGAEMGAVGGLRYVTGPADVAVVPRHPETVRAILLRIMAFEVELAEGRCPAPDLTNTHDVEAVVALHKTVLPGKVVDRRGDEKLEALADAYRYHSAASGKEEKLAKSLWAEILVHLGEDADATQIDLRDRYIKTWKISEKLIPETLRGAYRGHGIWNRKEK